MDGCQQTPIFQYMWVIKHKLAGSPLEHMTAERLREVKGRLFVTVQGTDSIMHDSMYVFKTYGPEDICFDSKFR